MNAVTVPAWEQLPAKLSWKEKVALLTFQSLTTLEQTETPVAHLFEPGVYIREMRLSAGVLLTGREHLLGHEMQLLEGSVMLFAPCGNTQFDAYAAVETKPGFHAVIYCMTDIVARSVHPNPEEIRDVEALENKWFGPADAVIEKGRLLSESLKVTHDSSH